MSGKKLYPVIFGLSLAAFTAYISLDTFLIPNVYKEVEQNDSFVFKTVTQAADQNQPDNTKTSDSPKKSDKKATSSTEKATASGSGTTASGQPGVTGSETTVRHDNSNMSSSSGNQSRDEKSDNNNASVSDAQEQSPQTDPQPENQIRSEPVITENTYSDSNIQINITQHREYDTDIYVSDISVSSLEYLKAGLADNSYGKNITAKTSETAANLNAIFAVNGDFYGARESGYVIRNGVLYREDRSDNRQDLVIWADGSFEIKNENDISASDLLNSGAYQTFSFGPGLVSDNEITVSENQEVDQAMSSNPRTAIGILGTNHFVFVVSDGRTRESDGLSLYELAGFMKDLGAYTAYNLDGGGSATMYFNGRIINKPTTDGWKIKERSVSDIVYIGY